jgi:hypothetical protein
MPSSWCWNFVTCFSSFRSSRFNAARIFMIPPRGIYLNMGWLR